jgi:methylenetetrahydrofolate dehydrogenase (NADP+)/methenyltetrahydrofolate cyclohydrolase
MPATLIDGVAFANDIKQDVARRVAGLKAAGRPVHLVALLVGATPGGELYAQRQGEGCRALGIDYTLLTFPDAIAQRDLKREIRRLNADPAVTGVMMHLPIPDHLDTARLQYEIDVVKDVEGVNPANIGYVVYKHTLIAPCTALAAVELVKSTGCRCGGPRRWWSGRA